LSSPVAGHERAQPEPGTPAAELAARVAAMPYWYHRIELPHGVTTPGWAPLRVASYGVPPRLDGMRVLDVGAWDGFWTFEALKRGAREVVAIDDFSDLLGAYGVSERKGWENFDLCRAALGYDEQRCRRLDLNLYDISEDKLGRFDAIFLFGVIYHLRHPLLALDTLAAICDGEIYIESAILDDYSPYRGGIGQGYPGGQVVMEFYPEDQYSENPSNWWVPTMHCLGLMVRAAGFRAVRGWKLLDTPEALSHCRGFVTGSRRPQQG
jgi:tRNA (mo5U34)-methyltransferase